MDQVMRYRPNRNLLYLDVVGVFIFCCLGALFTVFVFREFWFFHVVGIFVYALAACQGVAFNVLHFPTIRYEIDGTYVVTAEGWWQTVRRSTPLDKITNVDVRQGPIDRALGIGDIWVFTPSTRAQTPEALLRGIEHPYQVKALILERSERAKAAHSSPSLGGPARHGLHEPGTPSVRAELLRETLRSLRSIEMALGTPGENDGSRDSSRK